MRSSKKQKPYKMIRLGIQLIDSPHNRKVMDELQATAAASTVQGPHASIKREDVTIIALLTTPVVKKV